VIVNDLEVEHFVAYAGLLERAENKRTFVKQNVFRSRVAIPTGQKQ